MCNLKRIAKGYLFNKATSDFYLSWPPPWPFILHFRGFFVYTKTNGKASWVQDSVLISTNLSWIIYKPHFISSCTRIIHVELEQKEINQCNFIQMFWRQTHSDVVEIYFENRFLLSVRHERFRLNGCQVIPDGGGGGPASHKINSGLWCWQDSRVGGQREGGNTCLIPPDFFMRNCLKFQTPTEDSWGDECRKVQLRAQAYYHQWNPLHSLMRGV